MRFHIFKCDRYEKSCRGGSGAATGMKAGGIFYVLYGRQADIFSFIDAVMFRTEKQGSELNDKKLGGKIRNSFLYMLRIFGMCQFTFAGQNEG